MFDPERYETYKSVARNDHAEFVPRLLAQMSWKEGERILDYGCGAGSVCTEYLLPKAQHYNSTIDGVDISAEMLKFAKTNKAHPLVQYYQGDILSNDFPLEGITFDRIFSFYVINFMKDYKLALKRFFGVLKSGGEFGFTVIGKSFAFELLETVGGMPKWRSYMLGYQRFLPVWYEDYDDAEKMLREALVDIGFAISDIKTEERVHEFELDTFIELFVSLNPFLKKIPVHLLPELKEDYRIICRGSLGPSTSDTVDTTTVGKIKYTYKHSVVVTLVLKP